MMAARFFVYSMPTMRIAREPSRPDRYGYYGRPGREGYFQDLTVDPWRSGALPFRSFVPPPFPMAPRIYDQPSDPQPISENRQPRHATKVPFGQAIKKLYKLLLKAEEFYREFLSSFESDVEKIKRFATHEILRDLWLLKVAGGDRNKKRSSESQGMQSDSDNDSSAVRKAERFEATKAKIIQALETAAIATLDSKPCPDKARNRLDSARRLQKKMAVASEQIRDLSQQASKDRKSCDELRYELELLKTLVDPEKNKGLYESEEDFADNSCDHEQKDEVTSTPNLPIIW